MSDETVVVDQHGDVRLKVGKTGTKEQPLTFQVCSRALARSSKVFDTMLYGQFSESKAISSKIDEDWSVELPEHDPEVMRIFLDIIHTNFQNIPRVLTVDQLYGLTTLTNYYDATALLAPWTGTWLSAIGDLVKGANQLLPKLLWISWELGCKDTFVTTCNRVLMESPGTWSIEEEDDLHTPADVMERIQSIRTHTAKALLDVFNEMIENLLIVDEKPRWCHHASYMGPHRCESMILGSITFCLSRAGLWPLPEPQDLEYSLVGLYRKLTGLVIHDIGQTEDKPSTNHKECNPRPLLLKQIKQIMDEIPSPVTESHIKHLNSQAAKLSTRTA